MTRTIKHNGLRTRMADHKCHCETIYFSPHSHRI